MDRKLEYLTKLLVNDSLTLSEWAASGNNDRVFILAEDINKVLKRITERVNELED